MAVHGWPSNLQWHQFRTIPRSPPGVDEDAQIQTDTRPPNHVQIEHNGAQFRLARFDVQNVVVHSGTWVVHGTATQALLNHEQGHWDIAGLCAYEYYRALEALRAPNRSALQAGATAALRRMRQKASRLQLKYDRETQHGRNTAEQSRWDRLIQEAIRHEYRALPAP